MNFAKFFSIAAMALVALTAKQAQAWTYTSGTATAGCSAALDSTGNATDFKITAVVNKTNNAVANIVKMTFVMDSTKARTNPNAHTDIIYIERWGQVYYYSDSTKTSTLIGTVSPLSYATEDGLVGVAVDRAFQNRIFLEYAHPLSGCTAGGCTNNTSIDGTWRVSVFAMDPVTHMINMSSEQVILDVKSFRNRWHTGGALNMDNAGNLYWDVGDNETAFSGPGNTHELRGGIVRIHPNAGVTSGYSIPKNNFWEVESQYFSSQGLTSLAAKYQDTSLVRREIYVKGTRNAYTASVNPYDGTLTYSQCGPDAQDKVSETQNVVHAARFAGWPFWAGTDSVNSSQVGSSQYGKNGSNEPTTSTWNNYLPGRNTGVTFTGPNGPISTLTSVPNTNYGPGTSTGFIVNTWRKDTTAGFGVDTLPPYVLPTFAYAHSGTTCAMGSITYWYDGRIANPGNLPPTMNNAFIIGDYTARALRAAKVDSTGVFLGSFNTTNKIFSALQSTSSAATIEALLDLQQGPDGALYVVNNNCSGGTNSGTSSYSDACSGIARIEYQGTCQDPSFYPKQTIFPTSIAQQQQAIYHGDVSWLRIGPTSFSVYALGHHEIQIMDSRGRIISSMSGEGQQDYKLPSLSGNGIYYLKVKTNQGIAVKAFSHI